MIGFLLSLALAQDCPDMSGNYWMGRDTGEKRDVVTFVQHGCEVLEATFEFVDRTDQVRWVIDDEFHADDTGHYRMRWSGKRLEKYFSVDVDEETRFQIMGAYLPYTNGNGVKEILHFSKMFDGAGTKLSEGLQLLIQRR